MLLVVSSARCTVSCLEASADEVRLAKILAAENSDGPFDASVVADA